MTIWINCRYCSKRAGSMQAKSESHNSSEHYTVYGDLRQKRQQYALLGDQTRNQVEESGGGSGSGRSASSS